MQDYKNSSVIAERTWKINPAASSIKSLTSGTKKLTVKATSKPSAKGKYYYVKVRACKTVSGKKYYGAWSGSKLSKKIK